MSDALLLVGASTVNQNLYYATQFLASDPYLYVSDGRRETLVVPQMEVGRAASESRVSDVRSLHDLGYARLYRELGSSALARDHVAAALLHDYDTKSVRVEPTLPLQTGTVLTESGIAVIIDPSLYEDVRRRKTPDEVRLIETAQRITEGALKQAIHMIASSEIHAGILHLDGIPLTSERIRAVLELELLRAGAIAENESIVAGGTMSSDPHATGTGVLRAGEPIVIDVFPRMRHGRVHADITRTVVRGDAPDMLLQMHAAVVLAQETALEMVRPGADGAGIHSAVMQVLAEAGFDGNPSLPAMPHGTGHGLGLDLHEAPRLGELGVALQEGDVITIEPGLYHRDIGGVRVEDVVVVTQDGYRNLTSAPKRLVLDDLQ